MADNKKSDASAAKGDAQEQMDKIQEQGYVGVTSDPTPDEAYALPNAGDGTPETDEGARKKALEHQTKMDEDASR